MDMPDILLSPYHYTFTKAMCWGNFRHHYRKLGQKNWCGLCVNVILCIFEVPPIIGQIISIFEMVLGKMYYLYLDSRHLRVNVLDESCSLSTQLASTPKAVTYEYQKQTDIQVLLEQVLNLKAFKRTRYAQMSGLTDQSHVSGRPVSNSEEVLSKKKERTPTPMSFSFP